MKFVLSAEGMKLAASAPEVQEKEGILWPMLEEGRDSATQWVLEHIGQILHDIGLWLIHVAPDALITLSMIFCLGAIASIPKTGKWTAIATIAAVVTEVIRKSTFGA